MQNRTGVAWMRYLASNEDCQNNMNLSCGSEYSFPHHQKWAPNPPEEQNRLVSEHFKEGEISVGFLHSKDSLLE